MSVLFLGDYITKFKGKITLKSMDAYVDNRLAVLGMENRKLTITPMERKESAANGDEEMLEGSEAETYRSVVGILMYLRDTVSTCITRQSLWQWRGPRRPRVT